ncbi:hypothetical protein PACTADRAFT_4770 [Pachysolen tannophilus NRRL Y-2460]|uniref:ABC transporter domain-containing protein n=1 Tax=Pachysolen tannophilus NRRL Y-2460 TaxID=669874 RepID=A0A1E4TQ78_PACTA|nr:hypothetical protein PACTADRAFT_4770 [Pachysolen tannophilus NRRL Y-2460]
MVDFYFRNRVGNDKDKVGDDDPLTHVQTVYSKNDCLESSSISSVNNLSFSATERVSIKVRDLSVAARISSKVKFFLKKRKRLENDTEAQNVKTILYPVSFDIAAGTVTAIMGGSGSGKTTLLNTLSNRYTNSANLVKEGIIEFNGDSNINSIRHAYVIQKDVLLPNLTCFETLLFAAELRLPKLTNKLKRLELVNEIILELGLKDCKNTLVGDSQHKGLSGGEKRRLSLGIQMLSNPSVLFLDEPTTGLDAYSAYLLIKTLKNLAKKGKTFIVSIHQPRSDIFFLFDNILVLSRGKLCYGYKCDSILPHFSELGYDVPENVNPADYLIDITSVDVRTPEAEATSSKRLVQTVAFWKKKEHSILLDDKVIDKQIEMNRFEANNTDNHILDNTKGAPFMRELAILTRRNMLLTYRDPMTISSLYLEAVIVGIVCGWVFYKPGGSLTGIKTVEGALYTSNGLQGYLMLLFEIYRLSLNDISVFDSERLENCISIPGFLISRRIAKLICEDFFIPFLHSIILYFMVGLRTDSARHYFIFLSNVMLNHMCSMTFAMVCIAISRNFAVSSVFGNLNFVLQSMACGFFVNAKTMPVYVRWTKYIAYVWYGFGAVISNQFTNYQGDCFDEYAGDPNVDTICASYSGEYIIKTLGFWQNWITLPLCVELCWAIGFYIIAGIIFKYKVVDVSLAKQINQSESKEESTTVDNIEEQDEKEKLQNAMQTNNHFQEEEKGGINVYLKDVYLGVTIKNWGPTLNPFHKGESRTRKIILNEINASFKYGSLNAIMGPSGSGKSSLLNLISGRVTSGLITKYSSAGKIFFNNYCVQPGVIRSICSYVSQDDDNLLPSLTVKETLQFAAGLRLSKKMSKREMDAIVKEIILKMGLRDCQNTPIGSEFIKGISGGEKRRVSIAIQLLNNPKVLLLDEPTSGLDSFTASSILSVLKKLSDEGKTVIMTIHQPRSDLFKQFGSILLLAKGGNVAYNGSPQAMITYFEKLGYPCPKLTNVADHVLDIISVNTQNAALEETSKKRVVSLLESWKKDVNYSNFNDFDYTELDKNEQISKIFGTIIREPAPFFIGYILLCKRQWLGVVRNPTVFFNRITQVAGMGVILCLFFAPLHHSYIGITNRLGLIQQAFTPLYFIGMINNVGVYPQERNFFYEEFHDNVVGLDSFFLSYLTIEVPFEIISGIPFACLNVLAVGLPRTPGLFFAAIYICSAVVNCGESLGIIFNTVFDHVGFAVNVISIFLSISTFMAGLMSLDMCGFLRGINWVSPLHYGVMAATNMSFRKEDKFTCSDGGPTNSDGSCYMSNGEEVLKAYGLTYNYPMLLGVLIVITFSYRFIIAYSALKLKLLRSNTDDFGKVFPLQNFE